MLLSPQKMQQENQWVMKIKSKLNTFPDTLSQYSRWSKRSIYSFTSFNECWICPVYRIPVSVTNLNKHAYEPQIVSFGPYHHDAENLRAMEEHKNRALIQFLKRGNKPLESFVDALAPAVEDLKAAYQRMDSKWERDTDAFLGLMIMDGCFVLEILRSTMVRGTGDDGDEEDYACNDPIFSRNGKIYIVPYLKRDMMKLENQIPMVVLEKMVAVQNDRLLKGGPELIRLILNFFSKSIASEHLPKFQTPLHILHIYRTSLLLQEPYPKNHNKKKGERSIVTDHGGHKIIGSATELHKAGIRIEKSHTHSLKDISFHRGILKLPLIFIDNDLESIYLNLIAFERFHIGGGLEITFYIFFMGNIIHNTRDVGLLNSCGIIQNSLYSNKAVVNLFNSLSKDIMLDLESSLFEVHKEVSAYCQESWHQWRANLIHMYFTNPWTILLVLATLVLFALTIMQTVYNVLSYKK